MHSRAGADYGELLLEAKEARPQGRQPCLRAGDGYRRTDTRLC